MSLIHRFHYTPAEAGQVSWSEWLLIVIGQQEIEGEDAEPVIESLDEAISFLSDKRPAPKRPSSR